MQLLLSGRQRLAGFSGAWEEKAIEELCEVKGGKRLPKGNSLIEQKTPHPYIRVADMYKGGVSLENIQYVPIEAFPKIKNYRIYKEDIFISVAGTLGIVGKIPSDLDGANLTENADRLTNLKCHQDYLIYYLMSDFIQKKIEEVQTIGAQPKLALTRIKSFVVKIPPTLAEQTAISTILSDMDSELSALRAQRSKYAELKQGMMQELLTGRVRLV